MHLNERQRLVAEGYASALRDAIVAARSWRIESRGDSAFAWTHFSPPTFLLPTEGWKVHVSCAAIEAARMCEVLLPILVRRCVAFKLPATLGFLISLNGGDCGETQLGKVLTIYPVDAESASSLAAEVDCLWPTSRGPVIPTDCTLRRNGAVGLRYGVIGDAPILVKANGSEALALRRPDGTLVEDERVAFAPSPAWAPQLSVATLQPSSPAAVTRIAGGGFDLVRVGLLQRTARATVLLALDGARLRRVIVKIAHRGVFGDEYGRDMSDALRREFAILSALPQDIGPRPLGLFESDGETVLVEEDLGGVTFSALPFEVQQQKLPEFAQLVAALHKCDLVHRDIKPLNVLSTPKGLRLIDFEISARAGDPHVVSGGTAGYSAPGARSNIATPADDLYALGATIAGSYLGYDPGLIPPNSGRLVGLMSLLGAKRSSELVADLVGPAERRPSASDAVLRLQATARQRVSEKHSTEAERKCFAVRSALIASLATEGYRTTGSPLWSMPHPTQNGRAEAVANGASGLLLALASVEHATPAPWLREQMRAGLEWLAAQEPHAGVDGLWVGNAGVALVLGVLGRRLDREDALARAEQRLRVAAEHESEDDLYSGHAGIAWAACLLASASGAQWPLSIAESQARKLLTRLKMKGGVPIWEPSALVGEQSPVLGAAHGSAGNAVALAAWGRQCGRPEALVVAAETFRALYREGRSSDGKSLRYTLGGRSAGNGEWCHGAAGYLWSMLAAFGDEPSLREEIDWAVGALDSSGAITNPTYCHGLAGRLETWQMLKAVPRHAALARRKAAQTVDVLRLLRQRIRGVCAWSSETPSVVVPCLWVGFMGTSTALARYAVDRTDALFSASWLANIAQPKAEPAQLAGKHSTSESLATALSSAVPS